MHQALHIKGKFIFCLILNQICKLHTLICISVTANKVFRHTHISSLKSKMMEFLAHNLNNSRRTEIKWTVQTVKNKSLEN